ncbi:MAG: carboxypeptidase Taq [Candidatus Latescibacterota bacterium]|jgi:carboxypeptidase Taq
MDKKYEAFLQRIQQLADLGHAQSLMGWDQETYMPPKGTQMRARAQGTLAGLYHEKMTADELVALVRDLQSEELSGDAAVNLRETVREQERALKIPGELVVEMTQTASLAHEAWVEARQKVDFSLFRPWLEKIIAQKRQVADLIGYEGSIYNALLDEYEPYAKAEEIGPLFADLRTQLVPLVEGIAATGKRPAKGVLDREFDVELQDQFGRQVIAALGFDMEAGRLDIAVHPFCSGTSRDDVRLTTRYDASWLPGSLFGSMHEAGHGMYEQGLPEEAKGVPAGQSISLGIHESQSRMWENMVGRSRPFWQHYFPLLQQAFPGAIDDIDLDAFYAAINQVEPSFIRVEADEVTYNLHIALRFEIEVELMEGQLKVADLPEAWNARMQDYLGVIPPDDAQGVLQDVHWSFGGIGYFPTYSLGNLYAAQFFQQAQKDIPDLIGQISTGQFVGLKQWLNEKIHAHGTRLTAAELVQEVTGEPLSATYFADYLQGKFGPLYDLS